MNTLFPVDKTVYAETPDNRLIRAESRLSDHWKVVGKHVEMVCEERSDDVPEFDVVSAPQLKSRQHTSRGCVEIFVSAQPGRRYRCPVYGCSGRPLCYEVVLHIDFLRNGGKTGVFPHMKNGDFSAARPSSGLRRTPVQGGLTPLIPLWRPRISSCRTSFRSIVRGTPPPSSRGRKTPP